MTVAFTRLIALAALVVSLVPSSASAVSDGAAAHYKQAHRRALEHHARGGALGSDFSRRNGATDQLPAGRRSELERRGTKAKRCAAPSPSSSSKKAPAPTTTHKTSAKVSPTSKPAAAAPPASVGAPSGKKGMAWSSSGDYLKNFANGSTKIMYTWGATCPSQANSLGIECASMLWSPSKNLAAWQAAAPSHKYLMGFNEFNIESQANMGVSSVVSAWNKYIRPYGQKGHYLVAPSPASSNTALPDMQEFFKTCGGADDNCGVSALSLHYYGTESADLISYVTKMHEGLNNLDVWLTEFACEDFSGKGVTCSQSMATKFLEEVVEWAEKTSWLKMYSPYGFASDISGGYGGVNNVNALMNGSGEPSTLGKWFLDYNP